MRFSVIDTERLPQRMDSKKKSLSRRNSLRERKYLCEKPMQYMRSEQSDLSLSGLLRTRADVQRVLQNKAFQTAFSSDPALERVLLGDSRPLADWS